MVFKNSFTLLVASRTTPFFVVVPIFLSTIVDVFHLKIVKVKSIFKSGVSSTSISVLPIAGVVQKKNNENKISAR